MLVAVIQITANIIKWRIMIITIEHLPFQQISAGRNNLILSCCMTVLLTMTGQSSVHIKTVYIHVWNSWPPGVFPW